MKEAPPAAPRSASNVRLLLELGRGGMGIVYLALARGPAGFAKLKVIKRLRPDFAAEPKAVEMFLAEARLAARLRHPNVVQTNEVGFDGRHYFLEMEYLEGQSLDALLRRAEKTGGVPLPVALWVLAQTCAGLHYAHELKDLDGTPLRVVHRDVSPHNVFVTYDGNVKVLDFGIAKAADSSADTQTGMVKGKARYMAPEQAARRNVDRRADVFAIGVMLWQALTGERLWGEMSDLEIFVKLQTAALPAPSSVKADVPRELDALCARALSVDPEGRPATVAEMGAAIECWLEQSGARVGTREVAAMMTSLFADRRAQMEREIETQIKGHAAAPETSDVPTLLAAHETPPTGSAALSHASSIRREPHVPTKVRQLRQIRGLRQMTVVAIGVALVASASAGVLSLRARSRAAAAASAAARSSEAATTAARGCTGNAMCARGSICRKPEGRCVALASPECKVLAEPGDVENDATVWFGAMLPTSGPHGKYGAMFTRAVDLVRRDFTEISHGLPRLSGTGPPRPLAFVACDDAAGGDAPAHHLVDDVGVPAIIGFGSSQEVVDLATSTFIPHDVLAIAAVNQGALITSIPNAPGSPRLVFRTAHGIAQVAAPVSLFVSGWIEPRLRRAGVVSDHTPLRVALVRPETTTALSIGDALFTILAFNGKSALENGDDFQQFVFSESEPDAGGRSPADVVDELLRFAPNVVIAVGESELASTIYAPMEAGWPRGKPRPYVVSTGTLHGSDLFAFLDADRERRRRYFGTEPPAKSMANAELTMRYNTVFDDRVTVNTSPAGTYDAGYLLAYAAIAAGDSPLTGSTLSRAIGQLIPPGPSVDVGPVHILEAVALLRSGRHVDLQGAMGRLDFDLSTGESRADAVIQCVSVDSAGKANDGIDSGLHYDASSRTLQGEMHCP